MRSSKPSLSLVYSTTCKYTNAVREMKLKRSAISFLHGELQDDIQTRSTLSRVLTFSYIFRQEKPPAFCGRFMTTDSMEKTWIDSEMMKMSIAVLHNTGRSSSDPLFSATGPSFELCLIRRPEKYVGARDTLFSSAHSANGCTEEAESLRGAQLLVLVGVRERGAPGQAR